MNHHPLPQAQICPPWCIVPREPDEPPGEHLHTAARREVPCVVLRREGAVATTLDIVRYRSVDGNEDWLYLGDGQQGLDLSLGSARRLATALTAYLASLP